MQQQSQLSTTNLVIIIVCILILIIAGCAGCPQYRVWNAKMTGKAELQRAEQNRQIQVTQSQAKMEAAKYEAIADTLRAVGVARANQIIGNSLKENEAYLRYLWISEMKETQNQIIYVPTEANLPILEATRFKSPLPETENNAH